MTALVRAKVHDFASSLADLKVQLRLALAGELAQLVARGVGDVVRTLVSGRTAPEPERRWGPSEAVDPWNDEDEDDFDSIPRTGRHSVEPAPAVAGPVALIAAVHVARWWLVRRGTVWTALGAGLGVGVLGLAGGAFARSIIAAFVAVADLLAVTDALDAGVSSVGAL